VRVVDKALVGLPVHPLRLREIAELAERAASRKPQAFDLAVRIPKDELTRLGELAEEQGRSLSGYATLIVLNELR
jgi:hypothetical protein